MASNAPNLAVLIDADNVSHNVIVGLLAEIANYGTASVKRIYGDWTSPQMNGWKTKLNRHSIVPIQQFAYTTGKNATDGALIIDAMDLLYTGRFSGFCIVSSDSDFTRLASRIREQGLTVYGFGNRHTPNAFVAACHKFLYFDVLNEPPREEPVVVPVMSFWAREAEANTTPHSSAVASKKPRAVRRAALRHASRAHHHASSPVDQASSSLDHGSRPLDQAALSALKLAVSRAPIHHGDWVNLSFVGESLAQFTPLVHPRSYGYKGLQAFIEASGLVDVTYQEMGDGRQPIPLVRLREDNNGTTYQEDSGTYSRKRRRDEDIEDDRVRQEPNLFARYEDDVGDGGAHRKENPFARHEDDVDNSRASQGQVAFVREQMPEEPRVDPSYPRVRF